MKKQLHISFYKCKGFKKQLTKWQYGQWCLIIHCGLLGCTISYRLIETGMKRANTIVSLNEYIKIVKEAMGWERHR